MTELVEFEELNSFDTWYQNEFEPYYERVFGSTNYLFTSSVTGEFPLEAINYRVSKMCAYKAYVLTNPNSFKPNAHAMQISKVNEAFKPFEDEILSFVAKSKQPLERISVRVSTSQFKYDPIRIVNDVSVDCDNFRFVASTTIPEYPVIDTSVTIPVNNTTTTAVQTNPVNGNVIKTTESTNTGSGGIIIGGIALAGLLLLLARKKDKKNEK